MDKDLSSRIKSYNISTGFRIKLSSLKIVSKRNITPVYTITLF